MQKVLRATDRAKTQAKRKAFAQRQKAGRVDRVLLEQQNFVYQKEVTSDICAARIARKENWLLGPLSPRRDAGSSMNTYGTVSVRRLNGVNKPGKARDFCIAEGDRVLIVGKGLRDQGKIGVVKSVLFKAEACTVKGLNRVCLKPFSISIMVFSRETLDFGHLVIDLWSQADIATPEYILEAESDKRPIRTMELPIPLSAVRLVYPLPNPELGSLRDVIIAELRRSSNGERSLGYGGRYVAGTEPRIYIPFPEKPIEENMEYEIDTLRIEVEEKTWTPTLFQPPMPTSIIDELRNKYSVFRDRHDEGYIRKRDRLATELANERSEKEELMLTPLEEYHRMKVLEKSRTVQKPLDNEMLGNIGELMARNSGEIYPRTGFSY